MTLWLVVESAGSGNGVVGCQVFARKADADIEYLIRLRARAMESQFPGAPTTPHGKWDDANQRKYEWMQAHAGTPVVVEIQDIETPCLTERSPVMTRPEFDKRLMEYRQAVLEHHRPGPYIHSSDDMQRIADELWHDLETELDTLEAVIRRLNSQTQPKETEPCRPVSGPVARSDL